MSVPCCSDRTLEERQGARHATLRDCYQFFDVVRACRMREARGSVSPLRLLPALDVADGGWPTAPLPLACSSDSQAEGRRKGRKEF